MSPNEVAQLIGQLGASGIFAAALVIVAKTFYEHLNAEILYLRGRVECLENEVTALRKATFGQEGKG